MRLLNGARTAVVRVCAVLLALMLFPLIFNRIPVAAAESDGMVRVKLTRLGAPSSIEMKADCDYYLASDPSVRVPAGTAIRLTASDGALLLSAGKDEVILGETARLLRTQAGDGGAEFIAPALSNRFCGDLHFTASGDVISTLLNIYVEDYLYGVVGYEMGPSSAPEALMAQAVAARSLALRQKASRKGQAYDLTDAADDQAFKGYSDDPSYADVIAAVDATRGAVLYYGDALADCCYTDSNGGQTESAANVWGKALPYSAVRDDPYDLEGAGAKRAATIAKDAGDLHPALREALLAGMAGQLTEMGCSTVPDDVQINAVLGVSASDSRYPAPSRLFRVLTFSLDVTGHTPAGEARTGTVTVAIPTYGVFEAWYELSINADDNETIWVCELDRAFEIAFRRSGHGVGMSQRGAQVLAKDYGQSCASILEYYYPGTELKRLELTDAAQGRATDAAETAAPRITASPIATARLSERASLRETPAAEAFASAALPAGATVDVYAVEGEWAAVGSGDSYGYVQTDVLTSFALSGVSVVRAEGQTTARVVAASAVIHQLPVTTAKALGRAFEGDSVRVYAWSEGWAMVETPSGAGYIALDALELPRAAAPAASVGDDVTIAPEGLYGQLKENASLFGHYDDASNVLDVLLKGSYVQVSAYNRQWAYVRTPAGLRGYVKAACLTPVQGDSGAIADESTAEGGDVTKLSPPQEAYVQASALQVYRTYSTASEVVATLSRGEAVQVVAYNAKWARLQVGGIEGYALLHGLTLETHDGAIEGGAVTYVEGRRYAYAAKDGVTIYQSWSTDSARLALLSEGERVQVRAYNTRWAWVRMDDVTGFMRIEDLRRNAASGADDVTYAECDAVTTAVADLYGSASLDGSPLAQLAEGTRVHVYAYSARCAYVEAGGQRGYLDIGSLRKVSQ